MTQQQTRLPRKPSARFLIIILSIASMPLAIWMWNDASGYLFLLALISLISMLAWAGMEKPREQKYHVAIKGEPLDSGLVFEKYHPFDAARAFVEQRKTPSSEKLIVSVFERDGRLRYKKAVNARRANESAAQWKALLEKSEQRKSEVQKREGDRIALAIQSKQSGTLRIYTAIYGEILLRIEELPQTWHITAISKDKRERAFDLNKQNGNLDQAKAAAVELARPTIRESYPVQGFLGWTFEGFTFQGGGLKGSSVRTLGTMLLISVFSLGRVAAPTSEDAASRLSVLRFILVIASIASFGFGYSLYTKQIESMFESSVSTCAASVWTAVDVS